MILGPDDFCFPTPDQTVAIQASNVQLLFIGQIVEYAAAQPDREYRGTDCRPESNRMFDQVHADGRVHTRDVDQATPTDVVPSPVEHDVDRPHVSRLPPEELADVEELESHWNPRTVHQGTVDFVVLQRKNADEQCPDRQTEPTIGEDFDVDPTNARVKFHAPEIIEDEVARRSAVACRWREQTFQPQEDA